jgi:hypothetical protein
MPEMVRNAQSVIVTGAGHFFTKQLDTVDQTMRSWAEEIPRGLPPRGHSGDVDLNPVALDVSFRHVDVIGGALDLGIDDVDVNSGDLDLNLEALDVNSGDLDLS